jgi:hypothetical protein
MPEAEAKLVSSVEPKLSARMLVLIAVCSLVYFLDGLIHSILGPLAPDMARSLKLSSAELGPIFSANLVGQCIGLVVLPLFVRRLGQRGIVLVSLIGFGVAQSASALSAGQTDLLVWRRGKSSSLQIGDRVPACSPNYRLSGPHASQSLGNGFVCTMKIEPGEFPQSWGQKHIGRIARQSRSGDTVLHDVQGIRQHFEVTWIVGSSLKHALKNWTDCIHQPPRHLTRNGRRAG